MMRRDPKICNLEALQLELEQLREEIETVRQKAKQNEQRIDNNQCDLRNMERRIEFQIPVENWDD